MLERPAFLNDKLLAGSDMEEELRIRQRYMEVSLMLQSPLRTNLLLFSFAPIRKSQSTVTFVTHAFTVLFRSSSSCRAANSMRFL